MNKVLISLVFGCICSAQTTGNAALEGLDPVLLTEGKEVPGLTTLTAQQGRFLYQFASEETRDRFKAAPAAYAIQLDGACARMGAPVGGSPDTYWVYNHRIYIFGSSDCYKAFSLNPEKYLAVPKAAWNPTAESRARGRALLGKAIEAMGGNGRLETVHSYVETRHPIGQLMGDVTITKAFRMPESYHDDTARGANHYGALITPDGALRLFRDEAATVPKSFEDAMRADARRELLPILLNRKSKGFDVYEAEGDELWINNQGVISKFSVDPASGRITALAWIGHDAEGFGEFRVVYSDYREAGGLQLPFRAEGSFEGKPQSFRAWTVESYQFNPPDIESRFQKPATVREQ